MNNVGKGFDKSQQEKRIDNLPKTGHLTGSFEIDLYGCWWEVVEDETCKPFWIIGEYPSTQNKHPKKRNTKTSKERPHTNPNQTQITERVKEQGSERRS